MEPTNRPDQRDVDEPRTGGEVTGRGPIQIALVLLVVFLALLAIWAIWPLINGQ